MIDMYFKSKSLEALQVLIDSCINVTPVVKGTAESTVTLEDGSTETVPAKGDLEYYYIGVRAGFNIPEVDSAEVCSTEEAVPVVGVWA